MSATRGLVGLMGKTCHLRTLWETPGERRERKRGERWDKKREERGGEKEGDGWDKRGEGGEGEGRERGGKMG